LVNPVFALTPFTWQHRVAVFLGIALLTFYSVGVRAFRARQLGGRFPLGSLVLCDCLFLGFVLDEARGPFLELTLVGVIVGAVAGGQVGVIGMLSRSPKARNPNTSAGVWDRVFDG